MVLSVGSVLQIAKMKVFAVVLAAVASVSCDPYTIGQVAYGYGHPAGVVTGVDYGHGLVSGVGAIGNRAVYGVHHGYYGKREAEAEPYTLGSCCWSTYCQCLCHWTPPQCWIHCLCLPWTWIWSWSLLGQVAAGLPIANAYATG